MKPRREALRLLSGILLAAALMLPFIASAEKPKVMRIADLVGRLPEVSLITAGPGEEVYQLEGHTAIRLRFDDEDDWTVNWGVFDFNSPNFIYRFCKGETDYSIGIAPMDILIKEYALQDRYLGAQSLDLTDPQKERLTALVFTNLLPENQTYRYNYVKDNCATRPLHLIELALAADSSRLIINMPPESTTFRKEMRGYHRNYPNYQFGIDLALGSGIDYEISPREQAFAPVYLEKMLATAEIESADGSRRPLVKRAETVLKGSAEDPKEGFPAPWIWVAAICAVVLGFTIRDFRRKRVTRWFDAVFFGAYGVLGCVLAFLVFISTHEATSPNVNLLWLNPLALIVPLFIFKSSTRRIVFWYQIANFAMLLAFLVWTPMFDQSINPMFIPLALCGLMRSVNFLNYSRK